MSHYLIGGAIIGVGIGFIYLMTGQVAGVSSFFTAIHSWWCRNPFFQKPSVRGDRAWKSILVVGLILGAALWAATIGDAFTTDVQWWRLLLGGVFVGFGTRTARGCTSGHGICGMSAGSPSSIASTLTFMGVAILTAQFMGMLGVSP